MLGTIFQKALITSAFVSSLLLPAVAAAPATATPPASVNVVGYSVVANAYKALEAAFLATPAGQGVTFTNSFGASDTQTTNVVNGQPADIVNLSYQSNVSALVRAGKVPTTWSNQELAIAKVVTTSGTTQQTTYPTPGMVTDSIVVFVVQPGNPHHLTSWANLVNSGVHIVTPNPMTSGSAKWNLLAAYSSQIALHKTATAAQDYLKALLENTIAQPISGSTAMATFLSGTGNVLLDYEDNALAAIAAGKSVQIVTPSQSLLIENPIALTTTGVTNGAAKAFYKYVFSRPGQNIFAHLGFRSVLKTVWAATKNTYASFRHPTTLSTVTNINVKGWPLLDPQFFGPKVVFPAHDSKHPSSGIVTYLEKFAGLTA